MRARAISRGLLFFGAVWAATLCSACMTHAVLQKTRPTTYAEKTEASIRAVTHAEAMASGNVLVCFEIQKGELRRVASVEVPLPELKRLGARSALDFGRDSGFDSTQGVLSYVFFEEQLGPGCPSSAASMPVRTRPPLGDLGTQAVYTSDGSTGLHVFYHSDRVLWSSRHDVKLAPILSRAVRTTQVPGQPAYWLAMPFALAFDAFIASFYVMGLRI